MLPIDFDSCDNCPYVPETVACLNCKLHEITDEDMLDTASDYDPIEDDYFYDDCFSCRFHGFCGGICIAYEM